MFATKNYGYLLAKKPETQLEGQDLIRNAEEMMKTHPYWAERKMALFVPVAATIDDS